MVLDIISFRKCKEGEIFPILELDPGTSRTKI